MSRQMSPGQQFDDRRSAAVSSSAEAALTIDTENFTADVTRKRKHNFHIGLSNEELYTNSPQPRRCRFVIYIYYIPYSCIYL